MAEEKDIVDIDEKELQDSKGAEKAAEAVKETEEVKETDGEAEGAGSGEETEKASEEPLEEGDENDGEGKAAKEGKPDPKDIKIEELTDKYKRLFAEFDNLYLLKTLVSTDIPEGWEANKFLRSSWK